MCLQPQISQPKLGQIVHVGGILKTSGPADFKSAPGIENWPRFVGVTEQNKISNSLCQYCTYEGAFVGLGLTLYIVWLYLYCQN